ncbi:MbtH family NRPS accessory protein [Streptomyces sp. G44]|uniref:MbtH family NRPS accessory protein n=1 Tax=Streptomyces sp. G44 TaxID=2807632 RepID=UPI001961EC48|nr:MbtH family NRPS accessory protein [Streptomyces sp. G44]MBM7173527.1 MbtH family NRPS accessory protein [Streptomyces sp. G44]
MAGNPFEGDGAQYPVLMSDGEQHSLRVAGSDIPADWGVAQEASSRADSLAPGERCRPVMRPASLISGS